MTAKERSQLIRFVEKLGRALEQLTTIVHPDALRRWIRECKSTRRPSAAKGDGKRTAANLRKLIVRLARENPGWGYTRIVGELRKLGITGPSRGTVRDIFREHRLDPAPQRAGRTWDEFLKLYAATLRLPTEQRTGFYVQHDRGAKFSAAFDDALKAAGGKVVKTPVQLPNLQAFVERFHQTLRREVLDHFILFGQRHLDHLTRTFAAFYHRCRPHQGKDNLLLNPSRAKPAKTRSRSIAEPTTISLTDVRCEKQLGGLLKHYFRKAG